MSLKEAHAVVTRLAERGQVPFVVPRVAARAAFARELAGLGLKPSLRAVPEWVSVRKLREKLGLSQAEFAARFGFKAGTVRNWEQKISRPGQAERVLLKLIETDPAAIEKVLEGGTD